QFSVPQSLAIQNVEQLSSIVHHPAPDNMRNNWGQLFYIVGFADRSTAKDERNALLKIEQRRVGVTELIEFDAHSLGHREVHRTESPLRIVTLGVVEHAAGLQSAAKSADGECRDLMRIVFAA